MTDPAWQFCRIFRTRFYRVWRYHPHATFSLTGKRGIEQAAAVVDDFGNLVFVGQVEVQP